MRVRVLLCSPALLAVIFGCSSCPYGQTRRLPLTADWVGRILTQSLTNPREGLQQPLILLTSGRRQHSSAGCKTVLGARVQQGCSSWVDGGVVGREKRKSCLESMLEVFLGNVNPN